MNEIVRPGTIASKAAVPIRDPLTDNLPEFGRWRDVQRIFGIKRGTLYRLISERKIRSITLREPGRKFGCRLIHLQSVREYLHSLMTEQISQEVHQ